MMKSSNVKRGVANSLFDFWNNEGILYCHWKSTDHLDASFEGQTDLDVLVDPGSGSSAEALALQCGFHPMQTAQLRTYPGVKDFVAFDDSLQRFVHLHLHYQLVLGDRWVKAFRMPVEKQFLANRVWLEKYELWSVHPIDELAIYICRMPVKFLRPYDLKRETKVIKEADNLINQAKNSRICYRAITYTPTVDYLMEGLSGLDIGDLASTSGKVRKEMQAYRRMNKIYFIFLSKVRLIYRILIELQRRRLTRFAYGRRSLSRSGRVVAFVGMDGAGKSSGIDRITKKFSEQVNVANVFLGSGKSGASWYRKVAFMFYGTKKRRPNISSPNKKYSVFYLLWIVVVTHEKIYRLNKTFKHRSSGRLVLVDRWPQDVIHQMFDGPKFPEKYEFTSWLEKVAKSSERKLFYRAKILAPDAVIQFSVSPETSLERKPHDLTLDEAKKASEKLDLVEWPLTSKLISINADQGIEQVDKELCSVVWREIM